MDHRLMAYLYFFNVKRDYFECHEYGEHLWLERGRPPVLKGLIQAAVTLYHLHNGNVRGGYQMWQRAKGYLEEGRPVYEDIDVEALISDIDLVYKAVPTAWYTERVSPMQIAKLKLPTVRVHILNDEIRRRLWTYVPRHLEES
ncbi:DUF309 domain-containing protein [Alicyclobacillus fastidiosus]|uniref:DUF309 domain-containing protein n=1 Tax=Alicyclobacillus fastidiosus TaxID=392011 RepID=A0ABY6ZFV3_9BACL|nr:DUF309 domain-containing protein [Alicyclobacillus fastidiosus]WAH41716.1 DUF309 domain-containing protein [Alicyclobacillus fastidiosus]GMA63397.1 hypothetical protein GCM10025859_38370 [Alicyclobacillus fastidiosus]